MTRPRFDLRDPRTVAEVHDLTSIPASTLTRWCRTGKVTAFKVGRDWIIDFATVPDPRASLRQLLEQLLDKYQDDNHATWSGIVPYVVRTEVVADLRSILEVL